MVKHFFLLLYLFSFTAGIGAITVAGFFYLKYPVKLLKNIILMDIFFSIVLLINTISFYLEAFKIKLGDPVLIFLLLAFYFSGVGLLIYFWRIIRQLIGIQINRITKVIFWATVLGFLIFLLIIFYRLLIEKTPKDIAGHYGYLSATIFMALGGSYNTILALINFKKVDIKLRPFLIVILIFVALIIPCSIGADLLYSHFHVKYQVALSPILYFSVNLIALIFGARIFTQQSNGLNGNPAIIISGSNNDLTVFLDNHGITERELEILRLITEGCSNQKISQQLFISPNTVKNHLYNIYKKIGVKSRYELMKTLMHYHLDA